MPKLLYGISSFLQLNPEQQKALDEFFDMFHSCIFVFKSEFCSKQTMLKGKMFNCIILSN